MENDIIWDDEITESNTVKYSEDDIVWDEPTDKPETNYLEEVAEEVASIDVPKSTIEEKKAQLEELKVDKEISELLMQSSKDVGSALKGAVGQVGSLATAIPANIAEFSGFNSDELRESQEYWQNLSGEARDELSTTYGDSELVKSLLFAAANPTSYIGSSMAQLMGISGTETAMNIAEKGDRSGATVDDAGDVALAASVVPVASKAIEYAIKPAVKLFSSSPKKTVMDDMLSKMSPDEKRATEEVLDVLDDSGIKKMDEKARDTIINNIDFSKSSDEVSIALKKEIDEAKEISYNSYDSLYTKADEIGKRSEPVRTRPVSNYAKALDRRKYTTDENKLIDDISIKLNGSDGKSAADIEVVLKDIMGIKSSPTPAEERIISDFTTRLKAKQESALGEADKDIYIKAREEWIEHQKQFTGRIEGKEGIGKKLGKIDDSEQVSDIPEDILSRKLDSKAVNGLQDLDLSDDVKFDVVKDFISKGIEKDRLNTPEGVKAMVSNIDKMNPETLGKFIGDDKAKRMLADMRALATVQDIVNKSGNIEDRLMDDLSKFVVSAGLLKVSPVYGTKGMLESAKRIFRDTDILPKNVLIERAKNIKDNKTRNRILGLLGRFKDK